MGYSQIIKFVAFSIKANVQILNNAKFLNLKTRDSAKIYVFSYVRIMPILLLVYMYMNK